MRSLWLTLSVAAAVAVASSDAASPSAPVVTSATTPASLQLRWELFNAPNRVNLGDPITTIGQLNTGQITAADAARQMQFGLKFVF